MDPSSMEQSSVVAHQKYKLVFLGDMAVGKSSVIERFMKGSLNERHNVRRNGNTAHSRHRLHGQEHHAQQDYVQAPAVGHWRTGKIQIADPLVPEERPMRCLRL